MSYSRFAFNEKQAVLCLACLLAPLLLRVFGVIGEPSGDFRSMEAPEGGVLIGADVPGTKVFYQDHLLGTVPVRLNSRDLAALGLPACDGKDMTLQPDGWGEGLFLGKEDKEEHKFHFLAPEPSHYLIAQTPWGPRTKTQGAMGWKNAMEPRLFRRDSEPVAVTLEPAERTSDGLSVRVTAKARDLQSINGHRPGLLFLWGEMETPWRRRATHGVKLPPEWASFDPSETKTIVVTLPLKESAQGVSLFCILDIYKEPKGTTLAAGSVYGDSVWIPPTSPTR